MLIEEGRWAWVPRIHRLGTAVLIIHYRDHNPPHLHVRDRSRGVHAVVEIKTRAVVGDLPGRLMRDVVDWVDAHEAALLQAWDDAQAGRVLHLTADVGMQEGGDLCSICA
jgi:hypothetical protein